MNCLMKKLLFIVCLISFSCKKTTGVQPAAVEKKHLHQYATSFLIGARPDANGITPANNPKNEAICRTELNAIQPTVYPYSWTYTTVPNLTKFKEWVNWGKQNNKKVMMHQLVAPNPYYPKWFVEGKWSAKELDEMLEFYIKSVVSSVGDNVDVWNVVNECLNGGLSVGNEIGKFRPDNACVWVKMGWEADASELTGANKINDSIPVYLRKAFEYTRKYTNSELELRDYGIEFSDASDRKLLAFYQLAKHLKNKGIVLGAVGFQCHNVGLNDFNIYGRNFVNLKNNIKKFKDLGLKVYLTEVDIAASNSFKDTPLSIELANKQKNAYKLLIQEALLAKVDGIFFWGVADGVDSGWYPYNAPLLYDTDFDRKPAYYGVLEALEKNK